MKPRSVMADTENIEAQVALRAKKSLCASGADNRRVIMDLYVLKTWIQAKLNIQNERGASMVEYGLLLALIAVIAIVALRNLGNSVSTKFSTVSTSLG
jgi:pilus assembly protein Flp/PilA